VATAQATFVPTGTTFSVTAAMGSTDLAVTAGSVAVHMPGRVFSVLAGHGVHITGSDMVRNVLLGKHPKVQTLH
jgi:ferric-dicitrate binding protein FerR (iron transport regulator)